MKILTWNALFRDRSTRLSALITHIRAVDPDVVLLQESSHAHARAVAEALGVTILGLAGTEADVSVPVTLARVHGVLQSVHRLPGNGRQYVVIVDVETCLGTVRLTNAHLRSTASAWRMALSPVPEVPDIRETIDARLRQLEAIEAIRRALPDPTHEVLAGDLNCVPGGPEHALITRWGLRDSAAEASESVGAATIVAANPLIGDTPGTGAIDYTLDFQFHSPGLAVASWSTVGRPSEDGEWPSDHLGIVVDYSADAQAQP